MCFIVMYFHGLNWKKEDDFVKTKIEEHKKYQRNLFNNNQLFIGGPFMDGTGGMAILIADTKEKVQLIIENDPAISSKIYKTELHPYKIALKK